MEHKTVSQRIEEVEKAMEMNSRRYENSVASILELLSAVIKTVGPDFESKVEETLNTSRKEASVKQRAEEAQMFDMLVAQKRLVPVEAMGPGTVTIGKEVDKNGNLMVDRVQIPFENFVPEVAEKLVGKGIGFVYETPGDNNNLVITGIYQFQKPPESNPVELEAKSETVSKTEV